MSLMLVVSSANFGSLTEGGAVCGQGEKQWEENTCGPPVLFVQVLDVNFPILTCCCR